MKTASLQIIKNDHLINKKVHQLMSKIIGSNTQIPLGGHESDIFHLKSAFKLIISIAGADGISQPEAMEINNRLMIICNNRLQKDSIANMQQLTEFCSLYIEEINSGQITKEAIMNGLPLYAEEYLHHTKRLGMDGNRVYVILFTAIMVSYSDGYYSLEEQSAIREVARKLDINALDLKNIERLAKITSAMRNVTLHENIEYNPIADLEDFYQELFT